VVLIENIIKISNGEIIPSEILLGAKEEENLEFKPQIRKHNEFEKGIASLANLNHVSYYIVGPVAKGGKSNDYIVDFRDVKTNVDDIEKKIEQLLNFPPYWITPFQVNHKGNKYRQYKIEIWPSKDICGISVGVYDDGILKIDYPKRYGTSTYSMTRSEANRISNEKEIIRRAIDFYDLLKFKVSEFDQIENMGIRSILEPA